MEQVKHFNPSYTPPHWSEIESYLNGLADAMNAIAKRVDVLEEGGLSNAVKRIEDLERKLHDPWRPRKRANRGFRRCE